MSQIS
jgi:hypothetical protein